MEQKLIYGKIANILTKVEAITKDNINTSQRYKFRGIDDVYNALHPLFKAEKVFCTTDVLEERREQITGKEGGVRFYCFLKIKFTYFAEDGSFVSSTTNGEGMDSGDKATNKAMSAAQKYSLIQMFLIPTKEGSHDSEVADPNEMKDILLELQKIGDLTGLQKYWEQNDELHKNKEFIDAVNKMKISLTKPKNK